MSSEELAEHATKVMHTLDEGIKGLADVDAFFAYIRHVGATHHQVPGFKAENFWVSSNVATILVVCLFRSLSLTVSHAFKPQNLKIGQHAAVFL